MNKDIIRRNNEKLLEKIKAVKQIEDLSALKITLSNILNWGISDLKNLENGIKELTIKELHILCEYFDIHPDDLFS